MGDRVRAVDGVDSGDDKRAIPTLNGVAPSKHDRPEMAVQAVTSGLFVLLSAPCVGNRDTVRIQCSCVAVATDITLMAHCSPMDPVEASGSPHCLRPVWEKRLLMRARMKLSQRTEVVSLIVGVCVLV